LKRDRYTPLTLSRAMASASREKLADELGVVPARCHDAEPWIVEPQHCAEVFRGELAHARGGRGSVGVEEPSDAGSHRRALDAAAQGGNAHPVWRP
jgi:hypothetical protein